MGLIAHGDAIVHGIRPAAHRHPFTPLEANRPMAIVLLVESIRNAPLPESLIISAPVIVSPATSTNRPSASVR
jgi:hypothetical protein